MIVGMFQCMWQTLVLPIGLSYSTWYYEAWALLWSTERLTTKVNDLLWYCLLPVAYPIVILVQEMSTLALLVIIEGLKLYLDWDINLFVVYRASGPSLLIESTDSMLPKNGGGMSKYVIFFFFLTRSEKQLESCNTCGEEGTSLKKCSKCKKVSSFCDTAAHKSTPSYLLLVQVLYCSVDCQKLAWTVGNHKKLCKMWTAPPPSWSHSTVINKHSILHPLTSLIVLSWSLQWNKSLIFDNQQ